MPKTSETLPLRTAEDVVIVRQRVRVVADKEGFRLVDQTKLVTAVSELARNTIIYGGGGTALIEALEKNGRTGVRVTFEDSGPGIPDIALALRDGYTSGRGMGLGLGGAKRLSNEFEISSEPGRGTRIAIARWR